MPFIYTILAIHYTTYSWHVLQPIRTSHHHTTTKECDRKKGKREEVAATTTTEELRITSVPDNQV